MGFFEPILLNPDANQGPLFGIFISGPLGFVVGAALGVILPFLAPESVRWKILFSMAGVFAAGVLVFCLLEPKYMGQLLRGQVVSVESAEALVGAAIHRSGGRVLTVRPTEAWEVYQHRKPWNYGQFLLRREVVLADVRGYVAPGFDGTGGDFFAVSAMPGPDWPPREIPIFLGVVEFVPPPSDLVRP